MEARGRDKHSRYEINERRGGYLVYLVSLIFTMMGWKNWTPNRVPSPLAHGPGIPLQRSQPVGDNPEQQIFWAKRYRDARNRATPWHNFNPCHHNQPSSVPLANIMYCANYFAVGTSQPWLAGSPARGYSHNQHLWQPSLSTSDQIPT